MKLYTIKQLQGSEWIIIWSGSAKDEKDAKKKALKEITLHAIEDK